MTAVEAAACEAMLRLRNVVRARNDGMHRALARLQGRTVPATAGQSGPALGWGRQQYSPDRAFLWIEGKACGPVPEDEVMDRARNAPDARDHDEQQAQQRPARSSGTPPCTATNRPRSRPCPPRAVSPPLTSSGIDREQDVARREQALWRRPATG